MAILASSSRKQELACCHDTNQSAPVSSVLTSPEHNVQSEKGFWTAGSFPKSVERGTVRKPVHAVILRVSPLTYSSHSSYSVQPFIAFSQRFGSAATPLSTKASSRSSSAQKKKPLHELDLGKVDERKKCVWGDFSNVGSFSAFTVTRTLRKRIC